MTGCALGSLGVGTNISDVTYRNIYTWSSNQMMMIKSNGGSGTVSNVVFGNFIGHGNAYSLDVDSYWSSISAAAGNGVQLSNINFSNWTGTEANGAQRGPIKMVCADGAPCHNIVITDFDMWTETGSSQFYTCRSAYGTGFCLEAGTDYKSYAAVTTTVKTAPAGYAAPTMASDLKAAFGTTVSIPIPAIPTSFFPGATPLSKLAGAAGSVNAVVASSVGTTAATVKSSAASKVSTLATSVKTISIKGPFTSSTAAASTAIHRC